MTEKDLEQRRLDLTERELEASIELRKAELEVRRQELSRPPADGGSKAPWNTTSSLAIIGGVITLLTAILTSSIQGCHNTSQQRAEQQAQIVLERQKFQSALIQKSVERATDPREAAINLNFLWEAGLISDYDKVKDILVKIEQGDNAITLPSQKTFGGITGLDDRTKVQDTKVFPYSAVCQIRVTAKDGSQWISTGFLISPRIVLTSAFGLYLHERGGFAASVEVSPGRDGQLQPFGKVISSSFRVPQQWIDEENYDYCVGAIILPHAIDGAGILEIATPSDAELIGKTVTIPGYPGDKRSGEAWESVGRIVAASDVGFDHDLDTSGGMSGSPVIHDVGGHPYVAGIHVRSGLSPRAIRLDKNLAKFIQGWVAEGAGR